MKWLGIDQEYLHMKFSALNVDFSSPSPDRIGSRRPAQAGIKYSYPSKEWLWGVYTIQQTSANVFKIHVLMLDVCWIV